MLTARVNGNSRHSWEQRQCEQRWKSVAIVAVATYSSTRSEIANEQLFRGLGIPVAIPSEIQLQECRQTSDASGRIHTTDLTATRHDEISTAGFLLAGPC